jgi:hypothetical protein
MSKKINLVEENRLRGEVRSKGKMTVEIRLQKEAVTS